MYIREIKSVNAIDWYTKQSLSQAYKACTIVISSYYNHVLSVNIRQYFAVVLIGRNTGPAHPSIHLSVCPSVPHTGF